MDRIQLATRLAHGRDPRDPHRASAAPLYQTATFAQPSLDEPGEFDYTRSGNPTRSLLEAHLAELERAAGACAYTSGVAAVAALLRLLDLGDEVIAATDLYGGSVRLLSQVGPRQGITVRYVDATDLAAVEEALGPRTRLLLVESPGNPLLSIADIRALAALAHRRGVLLAVDNSMLTPLLQRPLELGADLVVASATKFLGGHSDVTAGLVAARDAELLATLRWHQNAEGTALAPFECWLLLRGLKTLPLRLERQCTNAAVLAQWLAGAPGVARVLYPGLPWHPGRAVHRRQACGDGAVISFTTGDTARSRRLLDALSLFDLAVSFGSVASSASLPCRMSHAGVPAEVRARLAPPADLVRLSIGVEAVDDLRADLARALESALTEPEPSSAA